MNAGRRLVFGLCLLAALPAVVTAQELWRGAGGRCPAEVTFKEGFLTVVRDPGPARLTALSPGFELATAADGEAPRLDLQVAQELAASAHVELRVPAECRLRVTSRGGHVTHRGVVQAPLDVETATGVIVLCIEEPADADVALATSGELTVDFSVILDYHPRQEPSKRGSIRFRSGAPLAAIPISLSSRQGAIRTVDCQVPRRPLPPHPEARK